ncbi:hypothetical protein D3C72_2288380 [compost metagenome]
MRQAAEGGHYPAQRALAEVYCGIGFSGVVPLNYVEGYKWWLLSYERMPQEEQGKFLGILKLYERELRPEQLKEAKRQADLVRAGYKK